MDCLVSLALYTEQIKWDNGKISVSGVKSLRRSTRDMLHKELTLQPKKSSVIMREKTQEAGGEDGISCESKSTDAN
jgi:hypothetical protein